MKRLLAPILFGFPCVVLLTGCLGLSIGSGTTNKPQSHTVGQQLVDLQKAKDSGAITESEYQAQKAKVLGK